MVLDLSFDNYHRLTALDYKLNGGASTHLEQYVWDAAGNLLKRKYPKQDGSAGDAYQYDDYDRLVGAKLGVPAAEIDNDYTNINTWAKEIVYALDPGQNRSSVTTTLAQQAPVQEDYVTESDSPRYETVSSIPSPLEYDGEGNLIWDGNYLLVYDFRNRLSEVYQCSGGQMAQSSSSSGGTGGRQQLFQVEAGAEGNKGASPLGRQVRPAWRIMDARPGLREHARITRTWTFEYRGVRVAWYPHRQHRSDTATRTALGRLQRGRG